MNIFVLDEDPVLAAEYHNDRHVCKMILETAQLLCTAHVQTDGERTAQRRIGDVILRPTHVNHPCARWARECKLNYEWLWRLGCALLDEYAARYGRDHNFEPLFSRLRQTPMLIEHLSVRTPWPQCMPPQYQGPDAVQAYRRYYVAEKRHLASWRPPATIPDWWIEMSNHTLQGA